MAAAGWPGRGGLRLRKRLGQAAASGGPGDRSVLSPQSRAGRGCSQPLQASDLPISRPLSPAVTAALFAAVVSTLLVATARVLELIWDFVTLPAGRWGADRGDLDR